MSPAAGGELTLADIERCFRGAVPGVLATADADGTPNVTYITRAHPVGDERIAISNQFMSKSARNLAENPRASLLLIDATNYDEYRLCVEYERTERRGHVFQHLRAEIDTIAAITGMQDVFRLRAADVFRVLEIKRLPHPAVLLPEDRRRPGGLDQLGGLTTLSAQIGRCTDLDTLVDTTLAGLDRLLGFAHSHLLLLDEEGRRLYTIGSHGFDADSVGAEVALGDGLIGTVAARCAPMHAGNLQQMAKYSRSIRRSFEDDGGVQPARELPMPGLPGAESRIAVPAMARGELIGVLSVDSADYVAFTDADEQVLSVVGALLASAIEHLRAVDDDEPAPSVATPATPEPDKAATLEVRFFAVDASTFLGNDYLIKGVAGRILWTLLRQHAATGRTEFSNKELRVDPTLDMPGFKDNLESRLILLKRRLDERQAPLRIERTGRGRFRLHVEVRLELTSVDAGQ